MAKTAQFLAKISRQCTHISTLATVDFKLAMAAVWMAHHLKPVNLHLTRHQIHLLATARNIVCALACHLQSRILWRHLRDGSNKFSQNSLNCFGCGSHVTGVDNLAFSIIGIRLRAPGNSKPVGLGAIHDVGGCFGGFTQSDGQNSRSQRIKRATMAGFLRIEQPAHPTHRAC